MISCKEMTATVTDYLEKRMPLIQRMSFRMHLMMCTRCRDYIAQMQTVVSELGHMPEEPVPDDVMLELQRQFSQWNTDEHGGTNTEDGTQGCGCEEPQQ